MNMKPLLAILIAHVAVAALAAEPAAPPVTGTIQSIATDSLQLRTADLQEVRVTLSPQTRVVKTVAATLNDVHQGDFIGTTALERDGKRVSTEVHIFAEALRGTGEGHYPWNQPDTTMTNGAVATMTNGAVARAAAGGKAKNVTSLTVTYKGGEQTVQVPADTPVTRIDTASAADLQVGGRVTVFGRPQPDDTFAADMLSIAPAPPQFQTTGDQRRTYAFPGTGERIPYHLYVPSAWNKKTKWPLLVVLHGAGAAPESPFERGKGVLGRLAEQRGYVVVAPLGYVSNGGYNNRLDIIATPRAADAPAFFVPPPVATKAPPPRNPLTDMDRERSEQDVLNVTDLVSKEYNVDKSRIYLMGNSMGGAGTWHLAQKYPARWRAISPSAGPVSPDKYPYARLQRMPVLVVHGDQDDRNWFDASRLMVEKAKQQGREVTFLPVPGGDHYEAWTVVAAQIFDFFDAHGLKTPR
jgi:poly(3-hydroxybutyrate) depolymerase